MKYTLKILSLILILVICNFLFACNANNISDEEEKKIRQAIEKENFLISQMLSINKQYTVIQKNPEEIVLKNYSLGHISSYDKYGNIITGFLIEDKTVYHNWYTLKASDDGIININMSTMTRTYQHYFSSSRKISIYDRVLNINWQPYCEFSFASLNGEEISRNYYYWTNNTAKILYPVMTNTTQFATTKIVSRGELGWNSSHTSQYRSYIISYIKIIFDDATYNNASLMEYRFSITTWNPYDLDSIYDFGEIL